MCFVYCYCHAIEFRVCNRFTFHDSLTHVLFKYLAFVNAAYIQRNADNIQVNAEAYVSFHIILVRKEFFFVTVGSMCDIHSIAHAQLSLLYVQ